MSTSDQAQLIQERLIEAFQPSFIELQDQSHLHVGHPGSKSGGGHYQLTIQADAFQGKNLLTSHQLIYQALGDLVGKAIHALGIKILKG